MLRRKPVTRIGEASHPGPILNMPGDGHCLYHALGWWARKSHIEMREILSDIAADLWQQICPWDTGPALRTYRADTRDTTQWGTALQIAACAKMFGKQIIVHTPFGPQTFGEGPKWHLKLTLQPAGHYDVIIDNDDSAEGKPLNTHNSDIEHPKPTAGGRNAHPHWEQPYGATPQTS